MKDNSLKMPTWRSTNALVSLLQGFSELLSTDSRRTIVLRKPEQDFINKAIKVPEACEVTLIFERAHLLLELQHLVTIGGPLYGCESKRENLESLYR